MLWKKITGCYESITMGPCIGEETREAFPKEMTFEEG